MTTKAALYSRISKDSTGEGAGVSRQREDGREVATRRGWEIVAEFEDNDTSASGKVPRPGFEALLEGLEAGRFSVVIAWNLDRLTRNRRDTVRLIETAQKANATIALVRGSDLDLSTPAGRMTAEILASVARNEIENKSDRQRRANRQAAEAGKPYFRAKAFGMTATGEHVPGEAEALAEAFERLLAGWSLTSICADLNRRGFRTGHGNPWRGATLRTTMQAPRNAGLRVYEGREIRGSWEPIVSESVWRAACALLADPGRKGPHPTPGRVPSTLLAGIATCAACGSKVYTDRDRHGHMRYRCAGVRCFSRKAEPFDAEVIKATAALVTSPGFEDIAETGQHDDPQRAALLTERRALLIQRDVEIPQGLAAGLSMAQVAEANRLVNESLAKVEEALDASVPVSAGAILADLVEKAVRARRFDAEALLAEDWRRRVWDGMTLEARRTYVRSLWVVKAGPDGVQVTPTPQTAELIARVGLAVA